MNVITIFMMLVLIAAVLAGPVAIIVIGARDAKRMPVISWTLVSIGTVLLGLVLVPLSRCAWYSAPWHSRILTQGTSPSGREYCVVQAFSDVSEPYRVAFYLRDAGGVWRWHYLGHEEPAWTTAEVRFHDDEALIFRDGWLVHVIDVPTDTEDATETPHPSDPMRCPAHFTAQEVFEFHRDR